MNISKKLNHKVTMLLSGEKGTVCKDHGGKLRICLVYPNTYHIGMSNLGFRIVYSLFNKRDDVVCERAFLPDNDVIDEHIRTGTPLFSLESRRSLISFFDVIAFSISFENDYPNVLKILDLIKLPFYSSERDERHPLLIMGGPCTFMNPEPLADFFDVIFVGEAEALTDKFIDTFNKSSDRMFLYQELVDFAGFYVPSLYETEYNSLGSIKRRSTLLSAPEKIKKAVTANSDFIDAAGQLIGEKTEFSNMHLIEAMRGCIWKCRFCAVGRIYNPVKTRSLESIVKEISLRQGITSKVGVISPSLTDYPHVKELLCLENIEFSITSLRADKKSSDILSLIKNKNSVSIAPEAGSERLRKVINKKITSSDIIETSRRILESGIRTLRLYFIIGLPTETDDDIEEAVILINKIRETSPKGNIVASVSTFVPKPFTPFQWHPMAERDTIKRRLKILRDNLKTKSIKIFHEAPKHSYMQGLFSIGDRRISKIIEYISKDMDLQGACRLAGIDPEFYISRKRLSHEIMPWDFIDNSTDKVSLLKEYRKALSVRSE